MKKIILSAVVTIGVSLLSSVAFAQGLGSDMWNQQMSKDNLFLPHRDFCDTTTEAFIQAGSVSNRGFCIEKTERTAQRWFDARQTCSGLGKRLPELTEYQYACVHGSGLSDLTEDYEWATNFAFHNATTFSSTSINQLQVVVAGYPTCYQAAGDAVAADGGSSSLSNNTRPYRCVR